MVDFDRAASLGALAAGRFDVLVLGGGMTGTGVALDAAARGLSVALVDKGDFASGTSSKSSKLVHGGLRYLQQREFALVRENLRERHRLLSNAPYLVQPLPFVIPLFEQKRVPMRAMTRAYASALFAYDVAGGWRIGHRARRISTDEVATRLPTVDRGRLRSGFQYYDARGDDARVALTLAQSANRRGAVAATYLRAHDVRRTSRGRVEAVAVRDELTGRSFDIECRSVVNATGVWAHDVAQFLSRHEELNLAPAKGVHISVAAERLPATTAAVLPVPGDRRSVFVIPFTEGPFTFIGTTDTAYSGSLDDPRCTGDDVDYLLSAVNAATSSNLTRADVTGVWAGLRPLIAPRAGERLAERTADLSRRHHVSDSRDGVVHVTGGKWTTYRQMAADAVDALEPYVGSRPKSPTEKMGLAGVGPWRPTNPLEQHLYHRVGERGSALAARALEDEALAARVVSDLDYRWIDVDDAVQSEMAVTLQDVLCRRTRAHLMDARATAAAASAVAERMAPALGWDDARRASEVEAYRRLVETELTTAGLEGLA